MPTGINTNNDSIVIALNNKVDLDLNNSSGILHTKNGGTGRDNGVANDVAINSNDSDLASNRGLFKAIIYDKVDFNTLTKQGLYAIAYADNPNGPGFSCRLVVIEGNLTLTQIALSVDGTKHKVRGRNSSGEWEDWIFVLTSFNVTDGVLFDSLTGKLSVDDSVVRTSGDQTISGDKRFSNNIAISYPATYFTFNQGDNTNDAGIRFVTNGGDLEQAIKVSKDGSVCTFSLNYILDQFSKTIGIKTEDYTNPTNENTYVFTSKTKENPKDDEVITYSYLKSHYNSLSENQTITGIKTFVQDIQITNLDGDSTPQLDIVLSNVIKGTTPSSDVFGGVSCYDNNQENIGSMNICYSKEGNYYIDLRSRKSSTEYTYIRVTQPSDGSPGYVSASPTRDTPNSNDIVTVDYLNKKIKELQDQITVLQQQLASN